MGRINNTNLYSVKAPLSLEDTFPISDSQNFGKTRQAKVSEVVSVINASDTILPEIQLRGSAYPANSGEDINKWGRTVVDVAKSLIINVSRLEVTIPNFEFFDNATLLLDVYKKERKKKVKDTNTYTYTRTGFRHELPVSAELNGRVNEWSITESVTTIDINPETYFHLITTNSEDGRYIIARRKGSKKSSKILSGKTGTATRVINMPVTFAFRMRYTRDGVTYETPHLFTFKMVLCYSSYPTVYAPEAGQPTPPFGTYQKVKIKLDI